LADGPNIFTIRVINPLGGRIVMGVNNILALGDKAVLTAAAAARTAYRTGMGGGPVAPRNQNLDGTGATGGDNTIMDA
jgi:hypothetical protein